MSRSTATFVLVLALGMFMADAVMGTLYAPLGVLGLWVGYGCPNPARAWWRSVRTPKETR